MKTLSLDVESYSSFNLSKSGVYRYVESPDFEILLFGYSIDGSKVQVVDLASGEKIPDDVLVALKDDGIMKFAHNSAFERICLSRYLGYQTGKYLHPESWKCSMVWAATMGLPLSLEGVGSVLKLDKQKLTEGKDLITYFCQPCAPTKANGQRTRNFPYHAPDKWSAFKNYNVRDVEAEMSIQEKLAKFPVPDSLWDEYHLSENINDRGVALDMTLVQEAIEMDGRSRSELTIAMKNLTEVDNPNSVMQLKDWLADNGMETDSLGKKVVAGLLEDAPDRIADVLSLRQQLAKSSIKKYQAMEHVVCSDGRARGMFQFYGANRTGRWCLTGDHEVLTDHGWTRLDEWVGGKIACWNPHGESVSFQKANQLEFPYQGFMYELEDKRISQVSTPDHRMYVKKRYGGEWTTDTVENMVKYRPSIPFTGYRQTIAGLEHNKLRVLVMVQADGHYCADGTIKLGFTKERKAERCKSLLRAAEIQFSHQIYEKKSLSRLQFTIRSRDVPLWLRQFRDKTFGSWLFDESADVFFDELVYWDGYRSAKNSIQYVTCNKQNADMVQAFAHISGRAALVKTKVRSGEHPNWSDVYYVDIWLTPINCHEIRPKPTLHKYDGPVYCAETATGYFLVRRKGRVWVTGNSGRLIQLQNLPQNHLPDLEQARSLVRSDHYEALEMLYDDVPDTLSQLIRTAFIPHEGKKFIVADFSAIEARVLAWLAGETWRLDLFREGGDIYCQSASQMFGVPVEKHGINGHLRQKGKISELACIAESELVLTDQGLIPIEKITKEQKLWDGNEWVKHDGVIYKGEKEVLEYEGLRATADHLVWVEGSSEPVLFGEAAASGAHLLQTGDGRRKIRMGEDHQSGEEMEQSLESLLCTDPMYGMRQHSMDEPEQSTTRIIKRLSTMFAAKEDPTLARQTINSGKTTMRKSKRRWLSQLWRARDRVLFSKCNSSRTTYDPRIRSSRAINGNRPNRHKWGLRSRKSSFCDTSRKLCQPASLCPTVFQPSILAIRTFGSYTETVSRTQPRRDHSKRRDSRIRKTKELAHHQRTARLYDIRNAGPRHRFTVSGKLVHNCGYGGSVGALKAMGALDMGLTEEELRPLVSAWRESNPRIVAFWWAVDRAVMDAVKERRTTRTHGITFSYRSSMLFITLPSSRKLAYVKPRIGTNQYGGECVTYEGVGATKKWERIESYGPKFVENIVQAVARDVLAYAMKTLRNCSIVMHIHDEIVIEADGSLSVESVCEQMGRTPPWASGLLLRADGYECNFYQKD